MRSYGGGSLSAEDIESYVRENQDFIADVLKKSEDTYARACALVLMKYGGTERDVELVKQEVEECN